MSTYSAPLPDMQFALRELAGLNEVTALPPWREVTPEIVDAVLTEAGKDHFFHVMKTHNHMSQIYSVGTTEKQLTDLLGPWLKEKAASVKSASN